jgi:plasmid segregation protein ParM
MGIFEDLREELREIEAESGHDGYWYSVSGVLIMMVCGMLCGLCSIDRVELLIGLPLQHYETYRKKFERYFIDRSDIIRFELNGKPYTIQITGAHAFPQAYSAAVTVFDRLKDSNVVNIVDVGGFTVDCLQLTKFKPNMTLCTSLYWGVNTLFQNINDQMRSTGGRDISNSIIEGILKKDPSDLAEYSEKRISAVVSATASHTERMLAEVAQKGFDLEEDKTVFMGGGSILLKEYIMNTGKVKKPVFIDDVHANAKGYRLLYNAQNGNANKQLHSA